MSWQTLLGAAIHAAVTTGKALLTQFYSSSARLRSYFLGCSLGGRQGVQAAHMFPDDFDGIVAGAPAVDFNNLYSWRAGFFPITGSINSSDFLATGPLEDADTRGSARAMRQARRRIGWHH